MFKKGYLPINEVTPAPLPPTATSWLVGLTAGVVVAIILSIVLAVVFGVVNANLRNDLNAATNDLATANTNLDTLEMFAMELAEMSGMNTTYEEFATGRCEIPKGCAADIYSGAYRLLLARTGPFTSVIAEVSPFDTLEAKKKKKDDVLSHEMFRSRGMSNRAPGQVFEIVCPHPPDGREILNGLLQFTTNPRGTIVLTSGQIANFNLTGPNIGNGAGQTRVEPAFPEESVWYLSGMTDLRFFFYWYPDYVPCAGDVFDLIAPTKFVLGAARLSIDSSKKRDIAPGPVQRQHAKKSVH